MSNLITMVSDKLYRGPRPERVAYPWIEANIKTIISLEGMEEDEKEAQAFKHPDGTVILPVISCPISTFQILVSGITQQYLESILNFVIQVPAPVLVHCREGRDRTGLVVATYRVKVQGWSKQLAMEEALSYGYRGFWNKGLNRTWAGFNI